MMPQTWCSKMGYDPRCCTEVYLSKFAEYLTGEEGLALSTCRAIITALGFHAKDLAIRGQGDAVPRPSQVQVVKSSLKVLGKETAAGAPRERLPPQPRQARGHAGAPRRGPAPQPVQEALGHAPARSDDLPGLNGVQERRRPPYPDPQPGGEGLPPQCGPDGVGPDPAVALVFNSGLRKHQKAGRVVHSSVVRYAEVTRCPVSAAGGRVRVRPQPAWAALRTRAPQQPPLAHAQLQRRWQDV